MRTRFARMFFFLPVLLFLTGTTLASSIETSAGEGKKAGDEARQQRAQCDAQCRGDYQSNACALEACLRDCGAVGPASSVTNGVKLTP